MIFLGKVRKNKMKTMTTPLEGIFDIEPNTTLSPIQLDSTDLVAIDDDQEHKEISTQLSTVYGYALEAFEHQTELVQTVDPKFAARNAEVAAQYLNIALNSVNSRVDARHKRDKIKIAQNTPASQTAENITNNILVTDRNTILRTVGLPPENNS
jgi:hypothetical protein